MSDVRLGRLPCDRQAIAEAPALMAGRYAAMPPPAVCDRRSIAYQPRMFANNDLPDCSAAGLANGMLAVGAIAGFEPVIDDALVPAFYAGCVGCEPTEAAMAATDGAVLLDVLAWQDRHGFDVGQQVPLVAVWGTLPLSRAGLAHAVAELGGAYLGIDLYERDMEMAPVWDDDGVKPIGALVGGHAVWIWDYLGLTDTGTGRAATWGGLQSWTWRWLARRLREAHGVWWRSLAPAMQSCVDKDRLAAEAAA